MNDAFWLTLDQENPFSSREEGLAAVALAAREATVLLGEEGSGLSSGFTAGDVGDKLNWLDGHLIIADDVDALAREVERLLPR